MVKIVCFIPNSLKKCADIQNVKLFSLNEWVIYPCLMYKKIFFLVNLLGMFWPFYLEPNVDFFLTFPFKFYLYKKFKLFIKDYLLLIYTFMCMIVFLRIIILSFQSHQTRILSAGLGMAWNRYGLSWTTSGATWRLIKVQYLHFSSFPSPHFYFHNLWNVS